MHFEQSPGEINWKKVIAEHGEKLKKIKIFLVDVDGVLTNGMVFYAGAEVGFNRFFHVSDGYAFKFLMAAGIKVGVISGGNSLGLRKRMEDLKPTFLYLGNEDKREAYLDILSKSGCRDEEMLYIADDLFDIPILKRVGFSATVPHAGLEVKEVSHYITVRHAGTGCVREVADLLRYSQGIIPFNADFSEVK